MHGSRPDDLLVPTPEGLYCPPGDFHIDPWQPVSRAVVTHAHGDHARSGSRAYLTAEAGADLLAVRVGQEASIESEPWGKARSIGGVRVSFHPAGHILGSGQVRVEHRGRVWVVTGDFKRRADPTTTAFEPQRCDVLVMESTFGLPIYVWPEPDGEFAAIRAWWSANQEEGRTSVLYAYALGKAQRLLAGLAEGPGPLLVHGAVARLNEAYARAGVTLPATLYADAETAAAHRGRALVVAPPSAGGTGWLRKFGPVSTAFASGWMRIRGTRRRRAADRGFVVSDHADWPGLLATVRESGAERVGVTHGYTRPMARHLAEHMGLDTFELPTRWTGETLEGGEE